MFNKKALTFALALAFSLLGMANNSTAGVISVLDGYQVNYGISMSPGSSNGSDLQSVFIFEWNESNFSATYGGTIAGTGNTYLSHIIDFDPTYALIMGFGVGIPGIGDEIDHLYTITSLAFSYTVGGLKWSEAFPGLTPDSRVGHNAMISLLGEAERGSATALQGLEDFVKSEGYRAAFDPRKSFVALEWTVCAEGSEPDPDKPGQCKPIGGSIPEPTSVALFGLGLAGLGWSRRKKV